MDAPTTPVHTPTNWIAGRPCPAVDGGTLVNVDPASGQPLGTLPDSGAQDVQAAVEAARQAQPGWQAMDGEARGQLLLRLAQAIEDDLPRFALAETLDTGKPIGLSRRVDIPRAVRNLRFFAAAASQFASESHDVPGKMLGYTLRRPVGVVGAISPWNLPLYLLTWKVAPALAAGCAVVAKPSELTPTTASMLAEKAAGILPAGVLNVVQGKGEPAGAALVTHPDVAAVTFTGSTRVGRWIGQACGQALRPCSLELGGKNAFIVLPDADLDRAVEQAVRAAFSNQGQICLCGSRMLVHQDAYERFVQGLLGGAQALQPGDPLDERTAFGSLVSHGHREKVARCVRRAVEQGARVLVGGQPPQAMPGRLAGGAWYLPTVLDRVGQQDDAIQEEIFGPVCTVQPFETIDQALEMANGTPYGLSASVWTNDLRCAHRLAEALEVGIVWINGWMLRDLRTPFGGVKQSGLGREGGWEAMRFFTEPKSVTIALGDQP